MSISSELTRITNARDTIRAKMVSAGQATANDDISDLAEELVIPEVHPVTISVTTPPTKTTYNRGETLNLTGMVVTALYSDNSTENITSQCTFNPINGTTLTESITSIDISWVWSTESVAITYKTTQAITVNRILSSIAITTPPTKTSYLIGEALDLTGIVVTATYESGNTAIVTSDCTFTPPAGTVYNTEQTVSVTASYTEDGITKIATTNVAWRSPADPVLNNNSWDIIKSVAQAGTGANYWNVGDRKEVVLNGTVGVLTLANYTIYAYILGFNHNQAKEGTAIHFQFGFDALDNGKNLALCDEYYTTGGTVVSHQNCFHMNYSQTVSGGWASSDMKTTIIPQFKNILPSALKSVLKAITKYTDNVGNGGRRATDITATSEEIFLLAEYEVFGVTTNANQYEPTDGKQAQYTYYANGNIKTKYNHSDKTSSVFWWLRSVYRATNMKQFCSVDYTTADGRTSYREAAYSMGFAPGFAVG